MSNEQSHSAGQEPQIDVLIAEYLSRVDAGETLTPEEFMTEHAGHAAELKKYFANVSMIDKLPQAETPQPEQTRTSLIAEDIDSESSETRMEPEGTYSSSNSESLIPEIFGRYKIIKVLGQGAMGAVYLARDTQLDRDVALKIPKFGDLKNVDEKEMLARFYREARAAATLRSPNICPVYDVGEINGQHYITMAYIKGRPLKDFTKSKQSHSEKQLATTIRKLALGLAEAHEIGVVHRDLKPANIMVDKKSEPVVMDFGLALRSLSDDVQVTQSGAILGTPAYMSPEQVAGDQELIGPPADIYALGVIMYELITGEMPFKGNLMSILQQISLNNPAKPSELRPDIDPRLEKICLRMIAGDLEQRYKSMAEVANDLQEYLRNPNRKLKTAVVKQTGSNSKTIPTAQDESNPALITTEQPKSYAAQLREKKSKPASKKTNGSDSGFATRRTMLLAGGFGGLILLVSLVFLNPFGKNEIDKTVDSSSTISSDDEGVPNIGNAQEIKLSDGLVGHWSFEQATGSRVLDSSGLQNHGRVESGVRWEVGAAPSPLAGKRSIRFEEGSMTVLPSRSLAITNNMAFAFWCQFDVGPSWRNMIDWGSLKIGNGFGAILFDYDVEGSPRQFVNTSNHFGLFSGQWHHVVVNCESSVCNMWVDGRLHKTSQIPGKILDQVNNLVIGREIQGSLDDVRIYNRALNHAEIRTLANQEVTADKETLGLTQDFDTFEFGEKTLSNRFEELGIQNGLAFSNPTHQVEVSNIGLNLEAPFCLEICFDPREHYLPESSYRVAAEFGPCSVKITDLQVVDGFIYEETDEIYASTNREVYLELNDREQGLIHTALQWTGEELLFFVNGKLVTESHNYYEHAESSSEFAKRLLKASHSADLRLGAPDRARSSGFLASRIYSVRISEGVRYVGDFKPEKMTNDEKTVALYDFHEGQGNVLHDVSGNGHDGKIFGAKWVTPALQNRRIPMPLP